MSEEGFRPLVDKGSEGFQQATPVKETTGGFSPLQFRSEEAPEDAFEVAGPPPEEPAAPEMPEPIDEPFEAMPPPEEPPPEPEPDPGILEVERQAFDMGFEKGEREGFLKGEERAMEMLVRLENLILGFEGAWKKACREREANIIRLSLAVVEKVVLARADRDDEMAARSLVEALVTMETPGLCTVRVNPEDFSSVERLRGDLFQRIANLREITILPDPVVEEGEVRLESDGGWLETSARSRLDKVLSKMIQAAGVPLEETAGVA